MERLAKAVEIYEFYEFDKAMYRVDDVNFKFVRICGYHEDKVIVGYPNDEGSIKSALKLDGVHTKGDMNAKSWDYVDPSKILIIEGGPVIIDEG